MMLAEDLIAILQKVPGDTPIMVRGNLDRSLDAVYGRLEPVIQYECDGSHVGSYDVYQPASFASTPPDFAYAHGEPFNAIVLRPAPMFTGCHGPTNIPIPEELQFKPQACKACSGFGHRHCDQCHGTGHSNDELPGRIERFMRQKA
jgi:hypothetical protein